MIEELDLNVNIPEAFEELFIPSAYKAFHGGRGGAKSRSFASALIIKSIQSTKRILCTREIQRSINASVKRIIDDQINRMGARHLFKSTEKAIVNIYNGSEFSFSGLRHNEDTIKSLEGIDICWIEEANRCSQSSLDSLIPTIRKDGSEIWASWNRKFATDPIDKMFLGEDGPPPDSIVRQVNFEENPFFPQNLRDKMEYDKSRDTDKYLHVWCGEPAKNSESRIFKNWKIEEFDSPDDAEFRFGADWGFSTDPTVLIRLWVDHENRRIYIDHEAYKVGCEIDKLPDLFQDNVPACRKHKIIADSARPETISFVKKKGFRIEGAKKGPGSVEDGIEFLKSYDIIIHPRCIETVNEFTMFSYKVDKLTNEVLTIIEDKDNHCIDSIRYAVEPIMKATARLRVRAI